MNKYNSMDIDVSKLQMQRICKGLSRRELSTKLGFCEGYISRVESKKLHPSPARTKKICDVLGVQITDIMIRRDDTI